MGTPTKAELTGVLTLMQLLKKAAAENGRVEVMVRLDTAIMAIKSAIELAVNDT